MRTVTIEPGMTPKEWMKVSWNVIQSSLLALADASRKASLLGGDKESAFNGYADGYGDAAHNFDQVKRDEWGALVQRLQQAQGFAEGEYVKEMLTKEYADAYSTAIRSAINMAKAEIDRDNNNW